MSRAGVNEDRNLWEIGQAIVAAWWKVLPDSNPNKDVNAIRDVNSPDITNELTTVFKEVLDTPFKIYVDPKDRSYINIVVPQPPEGVWARKDLIEYLTGHHKSAGHQYHEDLGTAVVFGCGR
jgi:hypothetical protein